MSAKFTPGPWCVSDSGRGVKQDLTMIGLSVDAGVMVASVPGGSRSGPYFVENDDEIAANTRLIAASPTMFGALKMAEKFVSQFDDDDCYTEGQLETVSAIRAAIAKALGDQS